MTESTRLRIVVLGAGSIGAYVGGALLDAGSAVTLIGRARMRERIATHGLHLSDLNGHEAHLAASAVPWVDAADEVQVARALQSAALVLVAVKSADTAAAAQTLARHLGPEALVCSLQNGIGNADVLRAALPAHRVCAGMVPFNVVQLPPSRLHRGTWGELMVRADPAWTHWSNAFASAHLPLQQRTDMREVQWGKLLLNLNNAINALSGVPLKAQLAQRGYRRILAALIDEALQALKAAGIAPAQIGKLAPSRMPFVLRLPDWLFTRLAAGMLKIDPQARSSMWEDLQAGRRTEVDEFNGAVARLAREHGLRAPCNEAIAALVRQAEQGGRRDWGVQALETALLSAQPTAPQPPR